MMSSSVTFAILQFLTINDPMLKPRFVRTGPIPIPIPNEPTTLALAIVGTGLIAVYFGMRRVVRSKLEQTPVSRQNMRRESQIERPKRGAA